MFDLSKYWYIVRQHVWVLVATFVTIVMTVAVTTFFKPPVYQAKTTLIIESNIPQAVNIGGTFSVGAWVQGYYKTQYEIIKSYTVVSKAIAVLLQSEDSEFKGMKNAVASLRRRISIDPVKGSRLVEIGVTGLDASSARRQADVLANVYIQHNIDDRRLASKDSFTWLSEQLEILKVKVEKSQRELLQFKEKEYIISLDDRQSLLEKSMSEEQSNYANVLTALSRLKTTLSELRSIEGTSETIDSLPMEIESEIFANLRLKHNNMMINIANLSKKYKPKHPQLVSLKSQLKDINSALNLELKNIINNLEIKYRINESNRDAVSNNLDNLKKQSMVLAEQAIQYGVLKREAEGDQEMYNIMLHKLKQADISGSVTANNIRIVDKARIHVVSNYRNINLIMQAGIIGLVLGLFLCFVFDYLDSNIRTADDVEQHLKEPLLGLVPKETFKLAEEVDDGKALTRFYRDIKTTIGFYKKEHLLKTLLLTSSIRNEGKTTSVVLLSKIFAQTEGKTLLIDADLFKPRIAKILNVEHELGLVDYLTDDIDIDDIIYETKIPNLYLIPAGLIPPNPVELIGSERIKTLVDNVKQKYDFTIVDAPPLSAALEVSVMAGFMDAIAVVVKADSTPRALIKKLFDGLKIAKGNIIGIVLTSVIRVSGDMSAYYYYKYYGKYYGKDDD